VPDARAIDPAVVEDLVCDSHQAERIFAMARPIMIGTVNFYGMLSGLGDTIQNNVKPPWSVTTAPDLRRRPLSGHGLAFGDNAEVSQALADQIGAGCSSRGSRYGAGCPIDDLLLALGYRRPDL